MKKDRSELIYDILCEAYGTEPIDFFVNVLGIQILDTNEMENAVIDNGLAEQYEFADFDNLNTDDDTIGTDDYDYQNNLF